MDLLTRRLSVHEQGYSALWCRGPSWLPHMNKWPEIRVVHPVELSILTYITTPPAKVTEWEGYSKYDKYLKVVAWFCWYKS